MIIHRLETESDLQDLTKELSQETDRWLTTAATVSLFAIGFLISACLIGSGFGAALGLLGMITLIAAFSCLAKKNEYAEFLAMARKAQECIQQMHDEESLPAAAPVLTESNPLLS